MLLLLHLLNVLYSIRLFRNIVRVLKRENIQEGEAFSLCPARGPPAAPLCPFSEVSFPLHCLSIWPPGSPAGIIGIHDGRSRRRLSMTAPCDDLAAKRKKGEKWFGEKCVTIICIKKDSSNCILQLILILIAFFHRELDFNNYTHDLNNYNHSHAQVDVGTESKKDYFEIIHCNLFVFLLKIEFYSASQKKRRKPINQVNFSKTIMSFQKKFTLLQN